MATCDIYKTAIGYKTDLSGVTDTFKLSTINGCIQKSIDYKLGLLVKENDVYYSNTAHNDDPVTFNSMNNNTLHIYNMNFFYVLFKLVIFVILGGSGTYLLKNG